MSNKEVFATIIKLPESDIVVTRKVPMTEETCSQLRELREAREEVLTQAMGEQVTLPFPTLIAQIVGEAHELMKEANQNA